MELDAQEIIEIGMKYLQDNDPYIYELSLKQIDREGCVCCGGYWRLIISYWKIDKEYWKNVYIDAKGIVKYISDWK
jgi:hypothetical protein